MEETVSLTLSGEIMAMARQVAERTSRQPAEVLVEWLNRFIHDFPVEILTDDQLIVLCDAEMDEQQQAALNELVALSRENRLSIEERARLDVLIEIYRSSFGRKAQAVREAIKRGLRHPLH